MSIVFLIGAGASCDAGMPLVAQLTKELRDRLPDKYEALFEAIARLDCEITTNYERFFEWLAFLFQGTTGSFSQVVTLKLDQHLIDAAHDLVMSSRFRTLIYEILRSRHQCARYQPGYFARLGDFMPDKGRLKVFTTNYDLCIEDACRSQGIDVITGFRPSTGQWSPSLFRGAAPGINLYKLHSSLNWSLDLEDLETGPLVEHYPPQWDKVPELLLGPGLKLQSDDPFVTLYSEFHRAIRRAKVCVAIGYSFRDNHIKLPVHVASRRGMMVIDLNPCHINFEGYTKIRKRAKDAFESGEILTAIRGSLEARSSKG